MTPRPAGSPTAARLLDAPAGHWLTQVSQDALRDDERSRGPGGCAFRALTGDQRAAGEARRFTWSMLTYWELTPLLDDAALVVTELLSNALRHGLARPPARDASPHPLRLGLLRRGALVVCGVRDPSNRVPELGTPGRLAESGRGLHLVNCLSRAWGWTAPTAAGKAVWAALSCSPPAVAGGVAGREAMH
ncbi:ATP-binding protein [Streptomyces lydicus]|uniref:ATP-binding protein n=1 Tax=Streptomyces lydicus TaxID=47763 RepID=UPI0037AA0A4C